AAERRAVARQEAVDLRAAAGPAPVVVAADSLAVVAAAFPAEADQRAEAAGAVASSTVSFARAFQNVTFLGQVEALLSREEFRDASCLKRFRMRSLPNET
ncbi:MAG: hypothetical protein KDA47_15755, partial [Planctomycetales bacterium]|nr:hypothetical protein [Planctomycetales bacterium]